MVTLTHCSPVVSVCVIMMQDLLLFVNSTGWGMLEKKHRDRFYNCWIMISVEFTSSPGSVQCSFLPKLERQQLEYKDILRTSCFFVVTQYIQAILGKWF